jgi:RimJ/RimL family protein N-acetyltransferase
VLRSAQGLGLATEAAAAVVDAAFATGRRRVWATVRVDNAASLRVADVGFRRHHSTTDDHGELVYLVCER